MRLGQWTICFGAATALLICIGCGNVSLGEDEEPCLKYVHVTSSLDAYDGVDLIVVVDDMDADAATYQPLTSGLYTLVNALTHPPVLGKTSAVHNMRVAFVSSDMGLQWGEMRNAAGVRIGGNVGGNTTPIAGCDNNTGKNGAFLHSTSTGFHVKNQTLPCSGGDDQCPSGLTCLDGWCSGASDVTVACAPPVEAPLVISPLATRPGMAGTGDAGVADDAVQELNPATMAACAVPQLSGIGCAVTQPLEALARNLETVSQATPFIVESHLLALMVVSPREDCSIRDKALFGTSDWMAAIDGDGARRACGASVETQISLFPTDELDLYSILSAQGTSAVGLRTYRERFVTLKNGDEKAVFFAAIAGVPASQAQGNEENPCQGDGQSVAMGGCLEQSEMQAPLLSVPVCERRDDQGGQIAAVFEPARRLVRTAQTFGRNGYVYSICNDDWTPAMVAFAGMMSPQIASSCYDAQLGWKESTTSGCPGCGVVESCDVMVEIERTGADLSNTSCPAEFYSELTPKERQLLENRTVIEDIAGTDTTPAKTVLHCPIPKIGTARNCLSAFEQVNHSQVGWFYCEKNGENFEDACGDLLDNDGDNMTDCDDDGCLGCSVCGGDGTGCGSGCGNAVTLTGAGSAVTQGLVTYLRCTQSTDKDGGICQ